MAWRRRSNCACYRRIGCCAKTARRAQRQRRSSPSRRLARTYHPRGSLAPEGCRLRRVRRTSSSRSSHAGAVPRSTRPRAPPPPRRRQRRVWRGARLRRSSCDCGGAQMRWCGATLSPGRQRTGCGCSTCARARQKARRRAPTCCARWAAGSSGWRTATSARAEAWRSSRRCCRATHCAASSCTTARLRGDHSWQWPRSSRGTNCSEASRSPALASAPPPHPSRAPWRSRRSPRSTSPAAASATRPARGCAVVSRSSGRAASPRSAWRATASAPPPRARSRRCSTISADLHLPPHLPPPPPRCRRSPWP